MTQYEINYSPEDKVSNVINLSDKNDEISENIYANKVGVHNFYVGIVEVTPNEVDLNETVDDLYIRLPNKIRSP